nr:MAG TPA: hypothetical protein [Caudoviricetes sp.]
MSGVELFTLVGGSSAPFSCYKIIVTISIAYRFLQMDFQIPYNLVRNLFFPEFLKPTIARYKNFYKLQPQTVTCNLLLLSSTMQV